jgi:hypothetical protein
MCQDAVTWSFSVASLGGVTSGRALHSTGYIDACRSPRRVLSDCERMTSEKCPVC